MGRTNIDGLDGCEFPSATGGDPSPVNLNDQYNTILPDGCMRRGYGRSATSWISPCNHKTRGSISGYRVFIKPCHSRADPPVATVYDDASTQWRLHQRPSTAGGRTNKVSCTAWCVLKTFGGDMNIDFQKHKIKLLYPPCMIIENQFVRLTPIWFKRCQVRSHRR
jgi:hypothetical protein